VGNGPTGKTDPLQQLSEDRITRVRLLLLDDEVRVLHP
jgi:hypothetical protein